jgi:DNA-binding beta-propeller fold protein YncE
MFSSFSFLFPIRYGTQQSPNGMLISWNPSTRIATRLDTLAGHQFVNTAGIVLAPGGAGLYVTENSNSIWYFDLTTKQRTRKDDPASVTPIRQSIDLAISADGTRVYYLEKSVTQTQI